MAADYIKINRVDPAATEANELLNAVRDLRSAYERLDRIRDKMNHNFESTGDEATIDWSQVETNWGIPPGADSVGPDANGARVFTLINGAVGAMEGQFMNADARDLTETVG